MTLRLERGEVGTADRPQVFGVLFYRFLEGVFGQFLLGFLVRDRCVDVWDNLIERADRISGGATDLVAISSPAAVLKVVLARLRLPLYFE